MTRSAPCPALAASTPSVDLIIEDVTRLLRDACGVPQEQVIGRETHLAGELRLDSVQRLTLVVELENRFSICFRPEDEAGIETVGDIAARIRQRLDDEAAEEGS